MYNLAQEGRPLVGAKSVGAFLNQNVCLHVSTKHDPDSAGRPVLNKDAAASIMARLYTDLVDDSLTEYSYDAELAGLSYGLHASLDHITLSVEGYNDKLSELHRVVVQRIASIQIDPKRFALIKDRVCLRLSTCGLAHGVCSCAKAWRISD